MRINFALNPLLQKLKLWKALFLFSIFFNCHASFAGIPIQHWTSTQGTRVYYVASPNLPMLDIEVTFDAGSVRDEQQQGIAALTAHLLETSAGGWNADEVAQKFAEVGAKFEIEANLDNVTFKLRTLSDPALLPKALAVLKMVLTQPRFTKTDFQREKNQALAELKMREESPAELADLTFQQAIFGQHPYAYPVRGYLETVSALKIQDIKHFYQRYYVAKNAVIALVGDVDKAQALQITEQLLHDLPEGKAAAPLAEIAPLTKASVKNQSFPSTQTHILLGQIGVSRQDADYPALYLGNFILGGSGLVSKLFNEVREKRGLAYSVYSYFMPHFQQGLFAIGLQTKNAQAQQALAVVNETLNEFMNKGFSETELNAAKNHIVGGFVLRFATNAKLIDYLTLIGFYQLPLDYLDTFPQKIQALSAEQVMSAFKKHITPQLFQTVMLGGNS